ncbi:pejvakin [Patella vulgata]|uniref:pejvakin n=1 Tax=Patella vulgata TaxID=6465 RepID=UPI00217F8D3A|nr:pejvakin [Patella vulgata]
MFSATAHQVATALGKDTLLPVPSINTADNIDVLRVVIKKRRKWLFFSRKPHYEATEFTLSDLLVKDSSGLGIKDVPTDTHVLTTYNSKTDFSLKGKFGADLTKELLDVKLGTADAVNVSSQLGTLIKTELTTPKLLALLCHKKINIDHPIVKVARGDGRKSLCVITSVIQLQDDGIISSHVNLDVSGEMDSKLADVDTDINEDKSKSMTIPKNTTMAFSMIELLISLKDGAFELLLSPDDDGGFTEHEVESIDGNFKERGTKDLFNVIRSTDKTKQALLAVQQLLEQPKSIKPLNELFREVEVSLDLDIPRMYTMEDLQQDFNLDPNHTCLPFLNIADFVVTDESITIPDSSSSGVFDAFHLLLTLLDELDDGVITQLSLALMVTETTRKILPILKKLVDSKETVKLTKEEVENITAIPIDSLLTALNIKIQNDSLDVPTDSRLDLHATYQILDALLG